MRNYILVGEQGVRDFMNEDWDSLNKSVLENYDADIIMWDREEETLSTLLERLVGWDNFIILSRIDIKDIESNTKIVVL